MLKPNGFPQRLNISYNNELNDSNEFEAIIDVPQNLQNRMLLMKISDVNVLLSANDTGIFTIETNIDFVNDVATMEIENNTTISTKYANTLWFGGLVNNRSITGRVNNNHGYVVSKLPYQLRFKIKQVVAPFTGNVHYALNSDINGFILSLTFEPYVEDQLLKNSY